MTAVAFRNVSKIYPDGTRALADFSLAIGDGELMVLVGPSGCGKSTALRMLAGLEEITRGEILINGDVVNERTPQQRNVAMVFQNYALYPHMTVRDNMAFPLRMRGLPRDEIARRVAAAADTLGLMPLLARKPKALSGGERQRVAMGRALVRDPAVFLMDEPLSNLDAKLRVQIRSEIAVLQRRLGVTTVYVTHDQVEAMTLGTRVAVLRDGIMQQAAAPQALYERPANVFVAGFIGSPPMNIFASKLRACGNDLELALAGRWLAVAPRAPGHAARLRALVDQPLYAGLRPEAFVPADSVPADRRVQVDVVATESLGHERIVYFTAAPAAGPSAGDTDAVMAARLPVDYPARSGAAGSLGVDTGRLYFFNEQGDLIGGLTRSG